MFEDLEFATSLGSDNHSGVHPKILQAVVAANRGHAHAYGLDEVSKLAALEFKRLFGDTVEAQYVFTGTAANVLSLSGLVKSFEAVIASEAAHLQQDECGAPEKFVGCKVMTVPSRDGRIRPEQLHTRLQRQGDQHFSQPRMVSLTQPTELGVCYTLPELRAWREWTTRKNLMLHIDGARLVNAAAFLNCSLRALTADIGVDVVSFGGTKNGLLGAEAVLLFSPLAKAHFKFYRKQAMQLSSKTRFLAAQFYAYLHQDLWLEIARHVTKTAQDLAARLAEIPEIQVQHAVESNALFVRLPKAWIGPLRERFFFYVWDVEQNLCRWMISFDWQPETNTRLVDAIREVRECFREK